MTEVSGQRLEGCEPSTDQTGEGVGDSFSLNRVFEYRVWPGIGWGVEGLESPRVIAGEGVDDLRLNRLLKRRVGL